jgi:membrane associated rhomboid family serine protease
MVLAGIVGNLATATTYQTGHANVGASTAVFGAIGLLAAWRLMDHLRWHGPLTLRGVGLPLVLLLAAVGLMSAGPQVDWFAHLYGALAGLLLGIPTHRLFHHRRQWAWQAPAALAAAGLILAAWLLALR